MIGASIETAEDASRKVYFVELLKTYRESFHNVALGASMEAASTEASTEAFTCLIFKKPTINAGDCSDIADFFNIANV